MVEIRNATSSPEIEAQQGSPGNEENKFRLVYSKSKVYVNPTAYARDNIPGFLALVKRVSGAMTRPTCSEPLPTGSYQPYIPVGLDT